MNAETLDMFEDHVEAPEVAMPARPGADEDALIVGPQSVASTAAEPSTPARRWRPDPVRHACPACHAWNWWSAGNGWTCRVCHPPASRRLVRATCSISHGFELIGLYEEGEPDEA